jgi:hypothetical protein
MLTLRGAEGAAAEGRVLHRLGRGESRGNRCDEILRAEFRWRRPRRFAILPVCNPSRGDTGKLDIAIVGHGGRAAALASSRQKNPDKRVSNASVLRRDEPGRCFGAGAEEKFFHFLVQECA